jgi:hypothetical protein
MVVVKKLIALILVAGMLVATGIGCSSTPTTGKTGGGTGAGTGK